MKSHLLVLPMILATTVAISDAQPSSPSAPVGAQAQAAALLSSTHASVTSKGDGQRRSASPASARMDVQASAAALLGGRRTTAMSNASTTVEWRSDPRTSSDAQAQAAALLRGSRNFAATTRHSVTGRKVRAGTVPSRADGVTTAYPPAG
jgi:hypothetical protein